MDKAAKLERLKKLKSEKIETVRAMVDYRQKNQLEFFDHPPNPGPNPKQAQILEAFVDPQFKTLGMSMGERAGKTTLLTIIGISVIIGKFLWNGQSLLHLFNHKKARKVRYVGQGWHDHIKAVVIPALEEWWPQARAVERTGNGVITDTLWKDVLTGGTIEIMSNTQRPEVHRGWKGDLILYDEPCKRDIYTSNARGLVDRKGKEVFACTLLNEAWIDRDIVKKVGPDGRPDKSVFWVSGSSYENVGYGITEEGLGEYANKLSDEERKSRIEGIPEYQQGLIYGDFSRKIHLFDHFKIPLNWMVDIAIDIHPRKPQAVLFVATDPRNERYICDEIFEHGDGTSIAEEIVRKVNQNSYRVNRVIIDPLSKGDSNNQETTFEKIFNVLSRYDMPLQVASKDITTGILEVKKHLKGPNNMPSIFLLNNCMRTLMEIEGYMWDKKTGKPLKENDDMMENLYRICLLKTEYEPPGDFYFSESYQETRNPHTGY